MSAKQIIKNIKYKKLASVLQGELADICADVTESERALIDVKYVDGKFVVLGADTYHVREKLKELGFQWIPRNAQWEMES